MAFHFKQMLCKGINFIVWLIGAVLILSVMLGFAALYIYFLFMKKWTEGQAVIIAIFLFLPAEGFLFGPLSCHLSENRHTIHIYDHCQCIVCSKTRNKGHRWNGCQCSFCKKSLPAQHGAHLWDGCKCTVCGKTRNENHNWNDTGCICTRCGKTKHDWQTIRFEPPVDICCYGGDECAHCNSCWHGPSHYEGIHETQCAKCGEIRTEILK